MATEMQPALLTSPSDKRQFRHVKLANELQVLLISDRDTAEQVACSSPIAKAKRNSPRKLPSSPCLSPRPHPHLPHDEANGSQLPAAVALSVKVGYFSDTEVAGIAHFLEHMLFMGTAKYPDENEWENYLSTHGGFSNASTDAEVTNFYFEVGGAYLQPALERFAQFFISPLFKVESNAREMKAVHSEFVQNLQSDALRWEDVVSEEGKAGHPCRKFGWGNLKTLRDVPQKQGIDVRQELLDFHEKHYSANVMKLVIHGGETLDELQTMAENLFTAVPNKNAPLLDFSAHGPALAPTSLGCVYQLVPVKDIYTMHILWSLPSAHGHLLSKPFDFIGNVIGWEGKGSLFSLLKRKQWANSLYAGAASSGTHRNTASWDFTVSVHLTKEGFRRRMEVVGLVFEYLRLFRRSKPEEMLRVWKEMSTVAEMGFQFMEKQDPVEFVEEMADTLQSLPESQQHYALKSGYAFEKYDPDLIANHLSKLTPHNCRVDVLAKAFEGSATQRSKWFDCPYSRKPIPAATLQAWADPAGPVNPALTFPEPNSLIASDFRLRGEYCDDRKVQSDNDRSDQMKRDALVVPKGLPALLQRTPKGELWYRLDTVFDLPRAEVLCGLQSPCAAESPDSTVALALLVRLFQDWMAEYIYPATVAELHFSLWASRSGLELKAYGFSHKLPAFVNQLMGRLAYFPDELAREDSPVALRFAAHKNKLRRSYNGMHFQPRAHANMARLVTVQQGDWPLEDVQRASRHITAQDLAAFARRFLSKMYITCLAHGNLKRSEALNLFEDVQRSLMSRALCASERPAERCLKLPHDQCTRVSMLARNPHEQNSAVQCYYQVGHGGLRPRALLTLLHHVMAEPCFDQLRTKEQLGYSVSCSMRCTSGALGFTVSVQSPAHDPEYLEGRVEAFLVTFRKHLLDMPASEYTALVQSLATQLRYPDNNLTESSNRMWEEIEARTYVFRRREEEASTILTVGKEELLAFFETHVLGLPAGNHRKGSRDDSSSSILKHSGGSSHGVVGKRNRAAPSSPTRPAAMRRLSMRSAVDAKVNGEHPAAEEAGVSNGMPCSLPRRRRKLCCMVLGNRKVKDEGGDAKAEAKKRSTKAQCMWPAGPHGEESDIEEEDENEDLEEEDHKDMDKEGLAEGSADDSDEGDDDGDMEDDDEGDEGEEENKSADKEPLEPVPCDLESGEQLVVIESLEALVHFRRNQSLYNAVKAVQGYQNGQICSELPSADK